MSHIEHPEYWPRFAKYAKDLEDFAKKHNLLIDMYYHDESGWSFKYRHPYGSEAKVTLYIDKANEIYITGLCYLDCYDEFKRYVKSGEPILDVDSSVTGVIEALETYLAEMLGWQLEDLKPVGNYKKFWSVVSKAEFEAISADLPEVKP